MASFATNFRFTANIAPAVRSINNLSTRLNTMSSNARGSMLRMGLATAYPVKSIYDMEYEINRLVASSGQARTKMRPLIDFVRHLGATTEHTALNVARGATILVKSGIKDLNEI